MHILKFMLNVTYTLKMVWERKHVNAWFMLLIPSLMQNDANGTFSMLQSF